jgi:multimeric flavodoxin WrbA
MKAIVIAGSSRNDGATKKLIQDLSQLFALEAVDLNDYRFDYYDYEGKNRGDDFLPLMRKLIDNYDVLIFLTPVYWYAMSGIMKVFFDRITDLLSIEKDLGRKLRGKSMAALSVSLGGNLGEHFWLPFSESANYLGMNYLGHLHTFEEEDETDNLKEFYTRISDAFQSK